MTLKDIAEMAGVSTMTVSNVINGKTSRVSQKTRDKINSIIEEYNYVPNMNARSLSNNSSHIIGVVTFLEEKEYASGYNYFENPYVSTMIGTIETELHQLFHIRQYLTAYDVIFDRAVAKFDIIE